MERTLIISGDGLNCEIETKRAFNNKADIILLNDLLFNGNIIENYDTIVFPGGFSYSDYLGSGHILARKLSIWLLYYLDNHIKKGKYIIGICNGFQVLLNLGLISGVKAVLKKNTNGKFINKWVRLRVNPKSSCVFTKGIEYLELPIRHGEGNFQTDNIDESQIVLQYEDNPNGSYKNIAGICNKEGNVFGLMPHPEAFLTIEQHPDFLTNRKLNLPTGNSILK